MKKKKIVFKNIEDLFNYQLQLKKKRRKKVVKLTFEEKVEVIKLMQKSYEKALKKYLKK